MGEHSADFKFYTDSIKSAASTVAYGLMSLYKGNETACVDSLVLFTEKLIW